MNQLKQSIFLLFFTVTSFSLFAQQTKSITHFTLDNGLEVYLAEDHNSSDVFGAVAVKAGSKYDPKDATGMAHYLEHMCFKGTEDMGTTDYKKEKPLLDSIEWLYTELKKTTDENQRDNIQKQINQVSVRAAQYAIPNEMDRMIKSIGGKNLNAFTSFEEIVYHNSFPGHEINKWLDLYSHRFENPVFRLFQPELEVVYEEKNRGEDDMFSKVFETYLKNFFKNHPYGQQTTIGRTEDLKNPDLAKMREYYNTYFVANNMALVISGDFNTQEIIPVIKEKFGTWPKGNVPQFPKYEEAPFKGREVVDVKMTPIKIGILGYRTVPNNDPDEVALQVMNYILSNESETGLLNVLREEGKLQEAESMPLTLNDYGALGIIFVPKIIGQSLEDAEKNITEAIEKLKKGEFNPELLISARNNLKVNYYQQMESNTSVAMNMVNCFIQGISWEQLNDYPKEVDKISLEDIKRVANKYLGSDYLVLNSKMGLPKKDKLKKPEFQPVIPKDSLKSQYAIDFEKIPTGKPIARFIDFEKDVEKTQLTPGSVLWKANNPINDIFSLQLVYHAGYWQIPGLSEAAQYVSYLGADSLTALKFKQEMSMLGCSYSIWTSGDRLNIYLSGLEENFGASVDLLQRLINGPHADNNKMKLLASDIETQRKLDNGDPTSSATILNEYLHYGGYSSYLDRLGLKDLKAMDSTSLIQTFNKALEYPLSIHYTGRKTMAVVESSLKKYTFNHANYFADTAKGRLSEYEQPTIYVYYRKDARQTHVYFYAKGPQDNIEKWPYANAFNSYFGGDMSSLAFQEIREFRSLAYSVYSVMHSNRNDRMSFDGYLGCQGDKTSEALKTMNELFKNMPDKPDRIEAIRTGLINSAYNARPTFRYLTTQVEWAEHIGLKEDPNKYYAGIYEKFNYPDISKYYKDNIQQLPISMAITGNKKFINTKELSQYGKVVVVKEKDILKN
jgi:predicted Zn-dependent peptidase